METVEDTLKQMQREMAQDAAVGAGTAGGDDDLAEDGAGGAGGAISIADAASRLKQRAEEQLKLGAPRHARAGGGRGRQAAAAAAAAARDADEEDMMDAGGDDGAGTHPTPCFRPRSFPGSEADRGPRGHILGVASFMQMFS